MGTTRVRIDSTPSTHELIPDLLLYVLWVNFIAIIFRYKINPSFLLYLSWMNGLYICIIPDPKYSRHAQPYLEVVVANARCGKCLWGKGEWRQRVALSHVDTVVRARVKHP